MTFETPSSDLSKTQFYFQHVSSLGWQPHRHILREHWTGEPGHVTHSYYWDDFSVLMGDLVQDIRELGLTERDKLVIVGKSLGGLMAVSSTISCILY